MTYTDPDFSTIYSRAAGTGSSARVNDTAGQVSGTTGKVAGATGGKGPDKFTGDAAEIGKTLSALATDAAISKDVWDDLKKSADAWKASAPTAEVMNTAEKAVTDAQAACDKANEAADAAPDDKDLAKKADDAGEALVKAKQALIDLQRKRKAANKALLEAISRAIAKAKRITGGQTKVTGDGTTGVTLPGQSTGTGSGTGTQSTGSGTPAARTASPTAKPSGTPAATPSSNAPSTTTSSTSGLTPAETAALLTAAQGQQNQQPQQAQQAAQQPTAQMPTMPQVPQQNQQQAAADAKRKEAEANDRTALEAAGLGGLVTGIGSPSSTTSSPSPTPAAQQAGTVLRGPEFKPPSLSGATAAQNPVTSGQSAANLTTPSDVAGRPQGTERTAFNQPAPGTHTSGAAESASQRAGETQQQGRPVTGGGMPMAPGMMGAPGGAAPASRQAGDGDRERGVASNSDPLGLMHERGDAVDGGTIAQNRDKPAA
ncbi:hypothetical protein MSP7336_04346 [Mycobacterium shimoidei]|uniref:Uncharacterized protein n=1 Tax=Mycobacterium shimoidei TaxID=29313 RepID=A0A375Z4H7_MYCSH|nr:hypothetical protein [Mycobacterium shimoidei]SRX96071.1 hypothetical protein MSP7336_04346 [Mycobacterium shimoidei]